MPVGPTARLIDQSRFNKCTVGMSCIFMCLWRKIHEAILDLYNNTTFYDSMKQGKEQTPVCVTSGRSKTGRKAEKHKVKIN